MKKNKILPVILLFLSLLSPTDSKSQRYGLPGIHNYTRAEYNAGTQNWSVAQADNGMMYFANNNGLLEFDGTHWKTYRDMELIYRSLCVDGKRIYVGAYNQLGYYEENDRGILTFHSLTFLVQNKLRDFDEIWRIHKTSYGIVFQSFKAIFIYNQGKIEIVKPRSKFHFSYYVNGILWIYDEVNGLMQLREGKVRQIPGGSFLSGAEIWTILPINDDKVIVGTAKKGLFRYDGLKVTTWNNATNNLLKKYQIFSGSVINKNYFGFGTIQNGLIVTDTAGKVLFHLNKERGILNNTVLGLGCDQSGNIWLGLDNGISEIHFNSPLTYIQNYFDMGSGYTSSRFGEYLYLGTNQGLFYIKWLDFVNPLKKKEDFHLIEGTEGQVWNLSIIDNTLLCGHNVGVFQIINNHANKISAIPGAWTFCKVMQSQKLVMVGHYSGISLLELKGNVWVYRNELLGFDQSSHFLEQDNRGNIWVSHGYKGLFKIQPDSSWQKIESVQFFDTLAGLPRVVGNNLFKIESSLVVATRDGIYRFDENTLKFHPDEQFAHLLPGYKMIDYLTQDSAHNIWYFHDQLPGVLRRQKDGSMKNITAPFFDLKGRVIPSYGHIHEIEPDNVIIGIEGGFALYTSSQYKDYSLRPVLHISQLQSGDSHEGSYRFNSSSKSQVVVPKFHFNNNIVLIQFAASQYSGMGIKYQYKLDGFDEDWSGWSEQSTKEYTNLPFGDYTFELKAMLEDGTPSPVLSYKFSISPPWYFSIGALVLYILVVIAIALLMYKFFLRSIEKSREKEKEQQRSKYKQREQQFKEEALETEKEMIRLRNEKLNLEMIHKEKELANSTMLIIQKNEILHKLRQDLNKIKSALPDEQQKNELNMTLKRIGKEIDNEKQWQVFNTHVEQVHDDLFKKLKELYPDLTPREISLCAYLRMNISSKEIATLMNISTRGVEISRYRIRKKLGIDRNANLTDFMMKL